MAGFDTGAAAGGFFRGFNSIFVPAILQDRQLKARQQARADDNLLKRVEAIVGLNPAMAQDKTFGPIVQKVLEKRFDDISTKDQLFIIQQADTLSDVLVRKMGLTGAEESGGARGFEQGFAPGGATNAPSADAQSAQQTVAATTSPSAIIAGGESGAGPTGGAQPSVRVGPGGSTQPTASGIPSDRLQSGPTSAQVDLLNQLNATGAEATPSAAATPDAGSAGLGAGLISAGIGSAASQFADRERPAVFDEPVRAAVPLEEIEGGAGTSPATFRTAEAAQEETTGDEVNEVPRERPLVGAQTGFTETGEFQIGNELFQRFREGGGGLAISPSGVTWTIRGLTAKEVGNKKIQREFDNVIDGNISIAEATGRLPSQARQEFIHLITGLMSNQVTLQGGTPGNILAIAEEAGIAPLRQNFSKDLQKDLGFDVRDTGRKEAAKIRARGTSEALSIAGDTSFAKRVGTDQGALVSKRALARESAAGGLEGGLETLPGGESLRQRTSFETRLGSELASLKVSPQDGQLLAEHLGIDLNNRTQEDGSRLLGAGIALKTLGAASIEKARIDLRLIANPDTERAIAQEMGLISETETRPLTGPERSAVRSQAELTERLQTLTMSKEQILQRQLLDPNKDEELIWATFKKKPADLNAGERAALPGIREMARLIADANTQRIKGNDQIDRDPTEFQKLLIKEGLLIPQELLQGTDQQVVPGAVPQAAPQPTFDPQGQSLLPDPRDVAIQQEAPPAPAAAPIATRPGQVAPADLRRVIEGEEKRTARVARVAAVIQARAVARVNQRAKDEARRRAPIPAAERKNLISIRTEKPFPARRKGGRLDAINEGNAIFLDDDDLKFFRKLNTLGNTIDRMETEFFNIIQGENRIANRIRFRIQDATGLTAKLNSFEGILGEFLSTFGGESSSRISDKDIVRIKALTGLAAEGLISREDLRFIFNNLREMARDKRADLGFPRVKGRPDGALPAGFTLPEGASISP